MPLERLFAAVKTAIFCLIINNFCVSFGAVDVLRVQYLNNFEIFGEGF